MSEPPSEADVRGIRLDQLIRKALADAWAQGITYKEAEDMAEQIVREAFPDILESEISAAVHTVRR